MDKNKEKLLKKVKLEVDFVINKVKERLEMVKVLANQSLKGFGKLIPEDQAVFMSLRGNAFKRISELTHLENSPYFMKCEVIDENGENKNYFFAKYEFSEQSIYSWVAPVASIRFESPGKVSFKLPNGNIKTIVIKQKEQYMIVDGKILFFSLELKDRPRELIYQEHFTKQKSEFILPEIVEQMEKSQDQVIRADHKGPLVISGPAGSGKTTLALHRVAYLTQVPDTSLLYQPEHILVLVQDSGTKEYFSKLLPSLGINNVQITTFSTWALKILGLEEYSYFEKYGNNEEERNIYEYQKLTSLREKEIPVWNKNISNILKTQYSHSLSLNNFRLLDKQIKDKKLDRFDLIVLLKSYFKKYKKFEVVREYKTFIKHKLVSKKEKTHIFYSLMVVDEFQNYLPEQLQILKSCLNEKTQSVVYVGDMAQQVKLGTIKNWQEIGETISSDRNVVLRKVYRNTKNILNFIKSLGYVVDIPDGLKEGPVVLEKITSNIDEELKHIKSIISKYERGSIGILASDESYLAPFKKEFFDNKNIHILTMIESQGVEFDFVCIVGNNSESFSVLKNHELPVAYFEERKRMYKDLLYVALTRAITELHILGEEKLSMSISKL